MSQTSQRTGKRCPIHRLYLVASQTRYGVRWGCTYRSCTVACWDGRTSTPADAETRALRHQCHELFDPLWKSADRPAFPGRDPKSRRTKAYTWLAETMMVDFDDAHFGMFDHEQCERAIVRINEFIAGLDHA